MVIFVGRAEICMVSLLDTGVQLITNFILSLFTMKPTLCGCLESSPLYHSLWPSPVTISKLVYLTSAKPMTSHVYQTMRG